MRGFLVLILCGISLVVCGQNITTFVGGGSGGCGFNGPATAASVSAPNGCIFDKNGNFYFANMQCHRICKVTINGIYSVIAGTGSVGFAGDNGPASTAKFNYPTDVCFDSSGNLYINDGENHRIRRIDATTGIITTIAGTGILGDSGDGGPATMAAFTGNSICFDSKNNLYLCDGVSHKIRKINSNGIISTFAGTGIAGFGGDQGPASAALLYTPFDVVCDKNGCIYVADANNKRIRKIDTFGIITTIAGNGIGVYNGDNIPATSAQFGPYKIAMDAIGNLFVSDSNSRVRKIDNFGIISTLAGTGTVGYNGDNIPATSAQVSSLSGIIVDLCGQVYFSDVGNFRIRKITMPPGLTVPTISLNSSTSSAPPGTSITINATVSNAGSSYIIHWLNKGIEFTTTTVPSVTYTKAAGVDTITARVVSTATYGCYDSTTSSGWVVSEEVVGLFDNPSTGPRVTGTEVWPNPVNNELHFDDVADLSSYRIYSIVGVEVMHGSLQAGNNSISVGELPAGMYMVEVFGFDGKRTTKRIVKE